MEATSPNNIKSCQSCRYGHLFIRSSLCNDTRRTCVSGIAEQKYFSIKRDENGHITMFPSLPYITSRLNSVHQKEIIECHPLSMISF